MSVSHPLDLAEGLFDEEERAFRRELREWLSDNPPPRVARDGLDDRSLPAQVEWEQRFNAAGYGGLHWPIEHGGRGLPMSYQLIAAEELALARVMPFRHRPTIVGMFMAGPFIIAAGSEEQQRRYLSRILALEDLWCQLFSEPDAGSDLASLRTMAIPDGNSFVVRGQKIWNSYAHLAGMGVLLARTDPGAPKHDGLTCFLLDMHLPGITVRPLHQMNGGREFNEVFFDDVRVPADAVIGGVGNGWRSIVTFLGNERSTLQLGSYAEMLRDAVDLLERARSAGRTGRDEVMRVWTSLMVQRWTALSVASGAGRPDGFARARSSLGKLQWAVNLQGLASVSSTLLGPRITAWEADDAQARLAVHSLLSSRSASIAGGTSEVQKNVMAERVLGLPRS
jgi:alkylation response protein AidB-like acyl-CoA dehydrogenase